MKRFLKFFFLDRSLAYKVGLTAVLPVILTIATALLVTVISLEYAIHKNFQAQSYEVASMAAQSLSDPARFASDKFLAGTISLLAEIPDVNYVMVLGDDNRFIIRHSDPSFNGQPFDETMLDRESTYNVSAPVIINGSVAGLVIVGFSIRDILTDFHLYRLTLILIGLGGALVGLCSAFLLARMLVRPVLRLTREAGRIGRGSFGQAISYSGKDELGRLTNSFNLMSQQLEQTLAELRAEQANLQNKVAERTRELRHLLKKQEETNMRLEEALKVRSRFLTAMSHELRTPLNAILGTVALLRENHFGPLTEKQEEYVKQIDESGRHLLTLVTDLLDMAKIDAGSLELEITPFDLVECIRSTLAMMDSLIRNNRLEVGTDLPDGLLVYGDYRRIRQVLFNLVSNAVKFTPEGGRITVSAEGDDQTVTVHVNDTGIGIGKEDQEQLFSEFYQVDQHRRQHLGGTGLGLALSRRLVELHRGRIWVTSEPGQGATFSFSLPCRPVEEEKTQ